MTEVGPIPAAQHSTAESSAEFTFRSMVFATKVIRNNSCAVMCPLAGSRKGMRATHRQARSIADNGGSKKADSGA